MADNTYKELLNGDYTDPQEYYKTTHAYNNDRIYSTYLQSLNTADTSYEQGKSTYGNNANAMRNYGLTGSGYAGYQDLLNASNRNMQYANADAVKNQSILANDQQLYTQLFQYQQEKDAVDREYVKGLYDSINTGGMTYEKLNTYLDLEKINREKFEPMLQYTMKNTYTDQIKNGGGFSTLQDLKKAHDSDLIDDTTYNEYTKTFYDTLRDNVSSSFYKEDGTLMSYTEVKDMLKNVVDDGNIEGGVAAGVLNIFKENYGEYDPSGSNIARVLNNIGLGGFTQNMVLGGGIDVKTITQSSFSKYFNSTEQTEYTNKIIQGLKGNRFRNGDVFDANDGKGADYYIYLNGFIYKISKDGYKQGRKVPGDTIKSWTFGN